MIDINTKFVTLIGSPLQQSFAARMQNKAFEVAGINMCYFYTDTDDAHLEEIIDGIRYMPSFCGAAITKPNKVKVIEYLDLLDPLCEKMGACNTIVKDTDGKLVGYNTDGIGFLRSVTEEAGFDPKGKTAFCIGAGGAGRAICAALAYSGMQTIYIMDMINEYAMRLVNGVNSRFSEVAQYQAFGNYSKVEYCDIVINASGVGMGKTEGISPMPIEAIIKEKLFFDACYNPYKTAFLLNAEHKGCRTLNGLGMSLYQGATQIELWQTEKKAPVDAMREELLAILHETQIGAFANSRI